MATGNKVNRLFVLFLLVYSPASFAGSGFKSEFSHFAGGFLLTWLLAYLLVKFFNQSKPKSLVYASLVSVAFVSLDQYLDYLRYGKLYGQLLDFFSHALGTFLAAYFVAKVGNDGRFMSNLPQPVNLNEDGFIGEGQNRRCFAHPEDASLCIKIPLKRGERSAKREIRYLNAIRRRGKCLKNVADYKGSVKTNHGDGDLFDLVRDFDGAVSKDLGFYLNQGDASLTATLLSEIELLRSTLLQEFILFSDLDLDNVLVRRVSVSDYQLCIIDGVGDNNYLQFLEYFRVLGNRRSSRKWDVFRRKVAMRFPDLDNKINPFILQ